MQALHLGEHGGGTDTPLADCADSPEQGADARKASCPLCVDGCRLESGQHGGQCSLSRWSAMGQMAHESPVPCAPVGGARRAEVEGPPGRCRKGLPWASPPNQG